MVDEERNRAFWEQHIDFWWVSHYKTLYNPI